jgi:hypothetical protein
METQEDGMLGFHPYFLTSGRLYPQERSLVLISVTGWVDPGSPECGQKDEITWKLPRTPSETEPKASCLMAQFLNQPRHWRRWVDNIKMVLQETECRLWNRLISLKMVSNAQSIGTAIDRISFYQWNCFSVESTASKFNLVTELSCAENKSAEPLTRF